MIATIAVLLLFMGFASIIIDVYDVNLEIDLDNEIVNIFYTVNGQRKQIRI